MTIALTFTALALLSLASFAAALVYSALACDLTGADVQDAGEYHLTIAHALKAPVQSASVAPEVKLLKPAIKVMRLQACGTLQVAHIHAA